MNTKPIYVVLSLIAVAAVAASLEMTPQPSSSRSTNPSAKTITIDSNINIQELTSELQIFKKDFKMFYDKLFKFYHSSSGQNLKVLGEAVSYATEMDTTLENVPTIIILTGMAKNPHDALLLAQNWVERTKASMDMHLYFIHRMENDPSISSETAEMINDLNHQIDLYQAFLSNLNQSLVGAAGTRTSEPSAPQ